MKPWLLYIVLAWQAGPLLPQEQKTIILQFDSGKECRSIRAQVAEQTKAARSIFWLKEAECRRCREVFSKERCEQERSGKPEKPR